MELIEAVTDRCIRRGLGFAGLAVATVMVALSFDLPLALRTGADMVAVMAVGLLLSAWRAPRRNMRHSEAWAELAALRPDLVQRLPRSEAQQRLAETQRRRLVWHAERLGLAAVGLWGLTLVALAARGLA